MHEELEEPLRLKEIFEPVFAQFAERLAIGKLTPGCLRDQNLAAVAGCHHSCRPMDVETDVSCPYPARPAGMDPDPNPDLGVLRPGVSSNRALGLAGSRHGVLGRRERDEERVSLGVNLDPAVALEG